MPFWPFCGSTAETCSYTPAVLVGLVLLIVIALFVARRIQLANEADLNTVPETPSIAEDSVPPRAEVDSPTPSQPSLDIGEQWLEDNELEDDSYGAIIYDYCGLRNTKVEVRVVKIDLNEDEIVLSLRFPKTNVVKIIVLEYSAVNFNIDDTITTGLVMADVSVDDDIVDDSPDYDSEVETPLECVDWNTVCANLDLDLYLSQATYDLLFPSAA